MNEQEQKAADYLLGKILTAAPEDVCRYADALQNVTVAARNRRDAEAIGEKEK